MGTYKRTEGQTIIETALMLTLLLLILFGITEFSRAWYTKNSLKNAARSGARVAVVTDGITPTLDVPPPADGTYDPCIGNPCPASPDDNNDIRDAVCCSPGVRNDGTTRVSLTYTDDDGNGLDSGDTILVSARTDFSTAVPNIMGSFIPSQLSTDASMRYEK